MNRRSLVLIIVFLLTAVLVLWSVTERKPPEDFDETPEQLIPDFTARGLETRIFESDGRLSHQIRADRMAHFSLLGRTELDSPVYISYLSDEQVNIEEAGAIWQITAVSGRFYENELLELEEQVTILNLSDSGYIEQIETEFLAIDLQTRTMQTDEAVTIRGPRFIVRGEGMRVDLEAQQLELIKHVETIFYPRPRAE
ncbi:LPS export ABC transporter periplasmic protein LptC [Aliidiomarina sanyensis]|uniref:Lipopolysaccharide export system protein LptC n=1 Tax=Aliidiomarina sanyensis TaxID=1249555 RepID=A0A432WIA5_9GAMM|nr:LPS export ABC transporter periplasmic protein LptC [Aliidiomarina sanyensis]RUO33451.1 LPS export ABC transporter periplasmic protein LptC [Aliidiomarina sanyensis]